jgi:hypothetical protein
MAKKRMSAEERKEFKGGKYMGGPAEEKAEKKKKPAKRMAMGGMPDRDGTMRYSNSGMGRPEERGSMPGRRIGRMAEMTKPLPGRPRPPAIEQPPLPPVQNMAPGNVPPGKMPGTPGAGLTQSAAFTQNTAQLPPNPNMLQAMVPSNTAPSMGPMKMRGGGLARKGTGQALAKGGLVKGAGCCQRGMKKPRMT